MNDMETKELNLCELLKGHEGETFYSPFGGAMMLSKIENKLLYFTTKSGTYICLFPNGHYQYAVDGHCMLFPSRTLYEKYPLNAAKAWREWSYAQKPKVWGDIKEYNSYSLNLCAQHNGPLDKAVSAMFKLWHLIEIGYGGNPTTAEKLTKRLYGMVWCDGVWGVIEQFECIDPIAFYTKEQAEDFLRHPENRQLLDEIYMTEDE